MNLKETVNIFWEFKKVRILKSWEKFKENEQKVNEKNIIGCVWKCSEYFTEFKRNQDKFQFQSKKFEPWWVLNDLFVP